MAVPAKSDPETKVGASLPTNLPRHGSLAETSLPVILLALYRERFDGRLSLARGRTQKSFDFQAGAPIASESNLPAERLSGVLEQAGKLTHADREEVDRYVAREQCQEGVALLKLGRIEPRELFLGLREQVRHRAVEAFGWTDGTFSLESNRERAEQVQPFRADPYKLVQEGLRIHWSLDRLLKALEPRMNHYASPGKDLAETVRRLVLDASVERLIAGLNGCQKLGVLICGAASSPAAVATFWVLDAVGALAYSESPARTAQESDGGPIEIEIGIESEAATSAGSAKVSRPNPAAFVPERVNPEDAKTRAVVAELRGKLHELNHYEVLGVARDAPLSVIRKAYFQTAKRYHPDAISRLGLGDMRGDAGEIFSRIALANETLSNAKRRAEYDLALAGGKQEIDVTTLAQAETFYRKGEILIRMGDFRGALEYLKNAVDLYPDEAVYQSDLGWAYYKKEPPERERAREHLRRALDLEPENSIAQFRISLVDR